MSSSTIRRYNYITRAKNVCGGRPVLKGTRIPVKAIVGYYKMGLGVEEILEGLPKLSPAQIYEALSFYHDHREEIERDIAEAGQAERIVERYGLKLEPDGKVVPAGTDGR